MTASATLTDELRRWVLILQDDLRDRIPVQDRVEERWRAEHRSAVNAGRTAAAWETWRDDRVTQAAVAWVLTTVFVRFCEDNALLSPVWISGPGDRHQESLDAQLAYFRAHPEDTDREWIGQAVAHLAALPATRDLVDEHSPLHWVAPSGDAATALLEYWRERDENGARLRDLTDKSHSTRFLGDLYQELSQHAKDTFALLQTPDFVEEFILDRTMEEALKERPLDGFRLIDPTCGSGHFLLGAFPRLLDRWEKAAPGLERRALVQKALDALHGVDLNPFAVAITRFRLTIAALGASDQTTLENAPDFAYHVLAGDSLLHGRLELAHGEEADATASGFTYRSEDLEKLREILAPYRYDVVVGNPPYITVKDKALNAEYRRRYTYDAKGKKSLCRGTYSMSVPFMARFFELAKTNISGPAGWIGQITANSFMKREFGVPLIEEFLSMRDLPLLIDCSGAHITGHGTPTVILVGRPQAPQRSTVLAVLGIRGEQGTPPDPANAMVWRSIAENWDRPGHEDDWTSTAELDRTFLDHHPWSLTGGAASDVSTAIDGSCEYKLSDRIGDVGRTTNPGDDDAFFTTPAAARRLGATALTRNLITGDHVRDYGTDGNPTIWWPYPSDKSSTLPPDGHLWKILWPYRTNLRSRLLFGQPIEARGKSWLSHLEWYPSRISEPHAIYFSFVSTHNNFSYLQQPIVCKQSAPLIKLAGESDADEYHRTLGVLNSSTACFWLKQHSHDKGNRGGERSTAHFEWEHFFEFTGTTLKDFPLPGSLPLRVPQGLDALAADLADQTPVAVCERSVPTRADLDTARAEHDRIRARMITLQDELDWDVYHRYGLITDEQAKAVCVGASAEPLSLGERAFEIVLSRLVDSGEEEAAWFTRHGSTRISELPTHWPNGYRDVIQARLDLIEAEPAIRLLEKPEYKRRWSLKPWADREQVALRDWLLDRLEDRRYWFDRQGRPTPRSVAQVADQAVRDTDLCDVLALWDGERDVPVVDSLTRLLTDQAVPYLAAHRYKDTGLRKREVWERTWQLQRREDAGETFAEPIPVPPRYTSADFRKNHYWQARGKLDVPKERFVAYPDASRDTDPTP
ncbi:MAG: BREX-2 system adenine-specific DNA-methyltransferase PglX, partial [Pseudonocardia sp.]|nr:BREX-2 system adenine-specific DNA-methyltransferase PglX [Pseudonocardia sp.]